MGVFGWGELRKERIVKPQFPLVVVWLAYLFLFNSYYLEFPIPSTPPSTTQLHNNLTAATDIPNISTHHP